MPYSCLQVLNPKIHRRVGVLNFLDGGMDDEHPWRHLIGRPLSSQIFAPNKKLCAFGFIKSQFFTSVLNPSLGNNFNQLNMESGEEGYNSFEGILFVTGGLRKRSFTSGIIAHQHGFGWAWFYWYTRRFFKYWDVQDVYIF